MQDPLKTHWRSMREPLVEVWNGLTDRDLDTIDGDREMLLDVLERRYHTPRDTLQWRLDELIGRIAGSEAIQNSPTAHHQWWDATLDVVETE